MLPVVLPDCYIIFQTLDICIIKNLPSSIKMPKQVQKFAKYQTNSIQKHSQRLLKNCQSGPYLVTLVASQMTTFNQSECFISSQHCQAILKSVLPATSRSCQRLQMQKLLRKKYFVHQPHSRRCCYRRSCCRRCCHRCCCCRPQKSFFCSQHLFNLKQKLLRSFLVDVIVVVVVQQIRHEPISAKMQNFAPFNIRPFDRMPANRSLSSVTRWLDYFQYLAICNSENYPNNVINSPEQAQHYAKKGIN